MEVDILGPVAVSSDGLSIRIDTPKERALLAVLGARAPRMVSQATLVDALWGDDPPATAERTLASHISRLRRSIGPGFVLSEHGSHRLSDDADVDAIRMKGLVDEAAGALAAGRPDLADRRADEARSLWRSEPFLDLADSHVRSAEATRLAELQRRATETWIAAQLALGHHESMVGEIESAIADDPLHEPLWGHLMTALYRSARQADALRAYERLRRTLREQLGVDPAPALARIELQILRQDPRLDLVPPPPPNSLPGAGSSFVGRVADIRSVSKTLDQHRVVTLVGPGGIGKSRLATAVAASQLERYPDGVWWIDLAPARHADAVLARVAAGLGLTDRADSTVERVVRHVERHPETLVVIDNCEHVRSTVVELVAQLLEAVPLVDILATSRQRLGVPGESLHRVGPMSIPPVDARPEELLEYDAVRLFVDRANDIDDAATGPDDLAAAAAICRRLDGVPLALELAASQTIAFTPRDLAARLADRITSLRQAPELHDIRYTSLDDAIAWSHELLSPLEQQVFAELSVFEGTFDLAAAAAVCGNETHEDDVVEVLIHLVDASLVGPETSDATDRRTDLLPTSRATRRFCLLAPIRDYAAGQLVGCNRERAIARHAAYYRDLASTLTEDGDRLVRGAGMRFRSDDANFQLALDTSCRLDDPDRAAEFALTLGTAWYAIGDLEGSVRLLDTALTLPTRSGRRRGWAHFQLVWPLVLLGRAERAACELQEAATAAARHDDARLIAAAATARAHSLFLVSGDIESALPLYERAVAACPPSGAPLDCVAAQLGLAQALVLSDRPVGVSDMLATVESILDEHPDDGHRSHLCLDQALLAWCTGSPATILDTARRGQHHADLAGISYWKQINLTAEGFGLLLTGDHAGADITLLRAARAALDDGNLVQFGIPMKGLAALASLRGDFSTAAVLLGAGAASAPDWPLLQRGLAPALDAAVSDLGDHFATEVDRGRSLAPQHALTRALA